MKILLCERIPGYPVSGGSVAFTAAFKRQVHAAHIQWGPLGRNADAVRVQTVMTDVPGSMSALSFVRRA